MRLLKSLKTEHGGAGQEGDFWMAVSLQKDAANSEVPVGMGTVAAKHKTSDVQVKYLQKYLLLWHLCTQPRQGATLHTDFPPSPLFTSLPFSPAPQSQATLHPKCPSHSHQK